MRRIDACAVGELVTDGLGSYARVSECVHGNMYYAYLAEMDLAHYGLHAEDAVYVVDYDEVALDCCS